MQFAECSAISNQNVVDAFENLIKRVYNIKKSNLNSQAKPGNISGIEIKHYDGSN